MGRKKKSRIVFSKRPWDFGKNDRSEICGTGGKSVVGFERFCGGGGLELVWVRMTINEHQQIFSQTTILSPVVWVEEVPGVDVRLKKMLYANYFQQGKGGDEPD